MSLEMSPCDRAHTTSYSHSIATMALSRIVSEIFNVEKCRDLEIRVRGHSRSMKVVPFDRLCMVYVYVLVFFSNIVSKRTIFEIFDSKNAVTLKTGLGVCQGRWKCHR